jgi:hypothetical protein
MLLVHPVLGWLKGSLSMDVSSSAGLSQLQSVVSVAGSATAQEVAFAAGFRPPESMVRAVVGTSYKTGSPEVAGLCICTHRALQPGTLQWWSIAGNLEVTTMSRLL